jgi:probable HAF family extracellular repeat protein
LAIGRIVVRTTTGRRWLGSLLPLLALPYSPASAQSIQYLTPLAGYRSAGVQVSLSSAGNIVAANNVNNSFGLQAGLWSSPGSPVGLGGISGSTGSFAQGISGDGTTVVGDSGNQQQAFRWTASTGMVSLGIFPGFNSVTHANAANADGSVIVGYGTDPFVGAHAFRWTPGGGFTDLGTLPGGNVSVAIGVSADGRTIAGGSFSSIGLQPFVWTEASGMVGLGLLPGTTSTGVMGLSANGKVVIGVGNGQYYTAFRWTQA